ncbi:MAG: J domain-containing protein [Hyphomicrobiaceae bacterium]
MFERNRIDNSREMGAVGVEITFVDGTMTTGKLAVPVSGAIQDVLNGAISFVEFEPYVGGKTFLAKSTIRTVRPLSVDRAPGLTGRVRDVDGFDPWQTLGLAKGTSFEKVKAAFHRAALVYHPDRYATAELPAEVRDYLAAMARRINAAFAVLEAAHAEAERRESLRTEPIYASGKR